MKKNKKKQWKIRKKKIECNGKTLSRIYKKQIGKKSMIFEYYKCWNAKGSHKNKCKFYFL